MWLYFRFALSYRDIEEMMAKRGVRLTYETVRQRGIRIVDRAGNCLDHGRSIELDRLYVSDAVPESVKLLLVRRTEAATRLGPAPDVRCEN